ncbi:cytochrome P450 2 sub U member 1 [Branchiostoma belcheri]|nr:cytochrome P450 2 sub U member 1 [Branchiostoma belcheri]
MSMCDLEYRDEPMLLMSWARRYGDVFMYHVGSRAVVVLNGYRTIQQALVKQADDFSSGPYMPITAQNSQKKGVIHVPYSPFWKQHRKITLLKMREIGVDKPVLDQKIAAEGLVQEILKKDNKPFNMTKMIQTAVSNIISTMLCGTRYEYDHPGLQRFIANVALNFKFSRLSMLPNHYPWTRWVPGLNTQFNRTLECNQEIRDHIREQLEEHVNSFDPSNIRDFMDAYLNEIRHQDEGNSTVNEEQLVQVIRDMFVAGIENIATALRWALLYSVLYPDIQARVQEEIDQVLGRDGIPTMANRKKVSSLDQTAVTMMPFTEATIEEVLRYATVAPHAGGGNQKPGSVWVGFLYTLAERGQPVSYTQTHSGLYQAFVARRFDNNPQGRHYSHVHGVDSRGRYSSHMNSQTHRTGILPTPVTSIGTISTDSASEQPSEMPGEALITFAKKDLDMLG